MKYYCLAREAQSTKRLKNKEDSQPNNETQEKQSIRKPSPAGTLCNVQWLSKATLFFFFRFNNVTSCVRIEQNLIITKNWVKPSKSSHHSWKHLQSRWVSTSETFSLRSFLYQNELGWCGIHFVCCVNIWSRSKDFHWSATSVWRMRLEVWQPFPSVCFLWITAA